MTWLLKFYHALTCQNSFRIRLGDGTLTHRMSYDQARDYIDSEEGTAEVIEFDPVKTPLK